MKNLSKGKLNFNEINLIVSLFIQNLARVKKCIGGGVTFWGLIRHSPRKILTS